MSKPQNFFSLFRPIIIVIGFAILFLLGSAVSAQTTVSGWTKPADAKTAKKETLSLAARAAKGEAPQFFRLTAVSNTQIKKYLVTPPSADAMKQADNLKKKKIGVTSKLPQAVDILSVGTIIKTDEGEAYSLRIESAGALQLRLHFAQITLSEEAQIFVYAFNNPAEFYGPYRTGQSNIVTPPLSDSEVVVEIFYPTKSSKSAHPLTEKVMVDQVSHIFHDPRAANNITPDKLISEQIENASSCNRDVTAAWSETAKSVALIQFMEPDGEYVCSGVLLNDAQSSGTPYFLTANHCIGNADVAAGTRFYWFFDRPGTPSTASSSYGAQLIQTSPVSDFSLLKIKDAVPAGVRFSGWTTTKPAVASAVTGIHHPQGDYKRISFGRAVSTACPSFIPQEFCDNFHEVKWDAGISEPGSSGGGLWTGSASDPKLVGQLLGGGSDCPTPTASDYFGRFDITMEAVARHLTGQGCQQSLSHNKQIIESAGGTAKVDVFANEVGGCGWTARSSVDWITLQTTQGESDATVSFTVEPNLTGKLRQGLLYMAGNILTVTQRGASETCEPLDIKLGETLTGNLSAGNCRSVINSGVYAVRYKFTITPGQFFKVALTSSAFDTYLTLIGPNGQVFYENDDYAYPETNSYMPKIGYGYNYMGVPIAGTYILEVSSYDVPQTGAFTLNLAKGCSFQAKSVAQKYSMEGKPLDSVYGGVVLDIGVDETCPSNNFQMWTFSNTDWLGSGQEPSTNLNYNFYNRYNYVNLFNNRMRLTIDLPLNTGAKTRRGLLDFGGHKILIEQAAACNSTNQPQITPEKITLDGRKQRNTLQVKQAPNAFCTWDFKYETPDWLTYAEYNPVYMPRTGDQAITYEIQENKTANTRTFAMKVGDKMHTVEQESYDKICPAIPITIGEAINGILARTDCAANIAGYFVDRYNFRGYAGQQVFFGLTTATDAVSFNLYSPQSVIVVSGGINTEFGKSVRVPSTGYWDLPQDGIYTVEISHLNPLNTSTIPYEFKVDALGGANCVFQIDRQFTSVKPEGGSFAVHLTATPTCPWTASSTGNWVQFPAGTSGNSNQTITVQVEPNLGASRSSIVNIAGRQFEVYQDAPCSFMQLVDGTGKALDGAYGRDYGGYLSVRVRTGYGCPLVVKNNLTWLKSAYSPFDNAVAFNLDKNTGALRRGEIEVSGLKVQVTQGAGNLAVVSAADYTPRISQQGIVSIFGEQLAAEAVGATSLPLPTYLSDVYALAFDSQNATYYPKLFYVSPAQINLLLPETMPAGAARIEIYRANGLVSSGTFTFAKIAPALFSAESNGAGIAAANIQRVKANGEQQFDIVSMMDGTGKIVGKAIDLSVPGDKVYLLLYGIGARLRTDLQSVSCEIDGQLYPVEYAGPQGFFAGVDQLNILLPNTLRGKGEITVRVKVEDKISNTVKIKIAP